MALKIKHLDKVNVPKMLASAALGPNHSVRIRLLAGVFIMAIGVAMSKIPGLFEIHFAPVHLFAEMVGSAVHGIGLVPFLELLLKNLVEAEA